MKFYIEAWKPKQIWLEMSKEQRIAYMAQLGPAIQQLTELGTEIISWGVNDLDTHNRLGFDFFAIWKFPEDEIARKFENIVADGGWYEYFDQVNIQGSPESPNDIIAKLISI
jgi:hypothetical protein